jgi:hypothetical protein
MTGKSVAIVMAGIGIGIAVTAWMTTEGELQKRVKRAVRGTGHDLQESEMWRRGKQAASGAKDRLKNNLNDAIDDAAATSKNIAHQAGEQLEGVGKRLQDA